MDNIVPLHPESKENRDDILLECAKMATLVGYAATLLDIPELGLDDGEGKELVMQNIYVWIGALTEEDKEKLFGQRDIWRQIREIFQKAFDEIDKIGGENND